ncbi:MAG TPA: hypothetical protein VNG51_20815 [Ktedonobacteraceae bacterium]|nr:hypothetical protein [Ktedonobacteraceae bacterium]
MRNDQIFAAASFSDIIKELMLNRPSGLLTLWRAEEPRQDAMQIIIEHGRPTHARRGLYEEQISTSTLLWLNNWRNIYFTFQPKRAILQLPAPENRRPSVTHPSPTMSPSPTPSSQSDAEHTPYTPLTPAVPTLPSSLPSQIIPSITPEGRKVPLTALPRYDRTIFLLINGRRTIADLAHLTRRPPVEIYASLKRLQKQQLIALE